MSSEEVASYTHLDGLGMRNKATEEVASLLYMIKESEPYVPSPRPGGTPASQRGWW